MKTNQMLINKLYQILDDPEFGKVLPLQLLEYLNTEPADGVIYTDMIVEIIDNYITKEDEKTLSPVLLACKELERYCVFEQIKPLLIK